MDYLSTALGMTKEVNYGYFATTVDPAEITITTVPEAGTGLLGLAAAVRFARVRRRR